MSDAEPAASTPLEGFQRRYLRGLANPLKPLVQVGEGGLSESVISALDDALTRLETEHPRPAKLVMLRHFGGLGMEEIAELLDVSLSTANRDWRFALSWLRLELGGEEP